MAELTKDHLHALQHALGLDQYGRGEAYRNYFVAELDGADYTTCRELVDLGLMTEHEPIVVSGMMPWFRVTERGETVARSESPKPPKLTRSQLRYQRYLNEDSPLPFREWITVDAARAKEGYR